MTEQTYADDRMAKVTDLVAIDPGNNGAIVSYNIQRGKITHLFDMPKGKIYGNSQAVWFPELMRKVQICNPGLIVVERVMTSAQQGPKNAGTFMIAFSLALAVGPAIGVPVFLLNPAEWKAYHGLQNAGKKSMSTKKARSVFADQSHIVNEHFKNLSKGCDKAEAALMAKYFADIKVYTRSMEDALW